MSILEMLEQSVILTVLGMTVVFTFLIIMVIIIDLTGKLINKHERDADIMQTQNCIAHATEKTIPPEHIAAISAAVTEHQKGKTHEYR